MDKQTNQSPIMACLGYLQVFKIISSVVLNILIVANIPQLFLWNIYIEIELLRQKGDILRSH